MPSTIITGGAVRLGRAFAIHLAEKGYNIALHYGSSAKPAKKTMDAILQMGGSCQTYPCDLRNLVSVESLISSILNDFSDVSLLINNASNFIQQNVEKTETQALEDTIHINLMAPFLLMREYKKKINRGMIINILDQRITKNLPAFAAYSVSKVGLAHLTSIAAVEWGSSVRVNGIAPGLILPPPWETENYLKQNAPKIPMANHGSITDLLKGLDYLIDSPFVNGEILYIDGGESKSIPTTY